jgi:hypothetical protein
MIDPNEAKTVTVFLATAGGPVSFVPSEDLTLRQAIMFSGVLSVDQSQDESTIGSGFSDCFLLNGAYGPFLGLAFPVPEGTPLFYNSTSANSVQLIFT